VRAILRPAIEIATPLAIPGVSSNVSPLLGPALQASRNIRQLHRSVMQRRPVDEQREPDELSNDQRRNHEQKRARENRQAETFAQ